MTENLEPGWLRQEILSALKQACKSPWVSPKLARDFREAAKIIEKSTRLI